MESQEQVENLRTYLNAKLVNRGELIETILAALVSSQHVFMLGPPGTGKSMIATEVAEAANLRSFITLLSKESTSNDLFGAISVPDLKLGINRRNVEGFLPTAQIAVLDEVWKANASTLNGLLTILNERRYDNGAEKIQTPLISALLASNEIPDDESLLALYDRCLFRVFVDYVETEKDFLSIAFGEFDELEAPSVDLYAIQTSFEEALKTFDYSAIKPRYHEFVKGIRALGVPFSDRRARQAIKGLAAKAWISGKTALDSSAWLDLVNMAWHEYADAEKIVDYLTDNEFISRDAQTLATVETSLSKLEAQIQNGLKTSEKDALREERRRLMELVEGVAPSARKDAVVARVSALLKAILSA